MPIFMFLRVKSVIYNIENPNLKSEGAEGLSGLLDGQVEESLEILGRALLRGQVLAGMLVKAAHLQPGL